MPQRLRHILIFLLFGLLFLPMLQQGIGLVDEKPLEGIGQSAPSPDFKLKNWLEGKYQDSLQDCIVQNYGFHTTLIRLNNQYYYSLFNTAIANGVIVGQNHYLYDRTHIRAYTGEDFLGEDTIQARMRDIRDLQQILKKKRIELMLVVVPGKATGTSAFLPKGTPAPGPHTNYATFRRLSDSLDVPMLDLIAWYRDQERTNPYPLYPSGAIHWSTYCATLAADTLFAFVSTLTDTPLSRFAVTDVVWDSVARGPDGDISRGMNLLFPLSASPLVYPNVKWEPPKSKLRGLSVGDSYYWFPFTDYSGGIFEPSHFWFYFKELNTWGQSQTQQTDQVDLLKEIESMDVVILYASDAHLPEIGWGFVQAALKRYRDPIWREQEINRLMGDMRSDADWMQQIAQKAAATGVSLDTMLRRDAIYVLENTRIQ